MPETLTGLAIGESLEAELAALRAELFDAELEHLRSRAADLRAQLSTGRWTSTDQDLLKDALRGLSRRRSVAVLASAANGKAVEYAKGFAAIFTALGWDVESMPSERQCPLPEDHYASDFQRGHRKPDRVARRSRYAAQLGSAAPSVADGSRLAPGGHWPSGSLGLSMVSRPGDTTAAVLGSALRRLGVAVARIEDPYCAANHLTLLIGKPPPARESGLVGG